MLNNNNNVLAFVPTTSVTLNKEPQYKTLSPREREVVALIVKGMSNKLIANELGISEHTAKYHVKNVLIKLGVPTRAAAAAEAVKQGLVGP